MNANELANLLEVDSWYKLVTREEIATMLRQQQAEIKKWTDQYQRLNENLEMWKAGHFKQQAEIEALKQIIDANNLSQNIGQFVKPTNEPVAWMETYKGEPNNLDWDKNNLYCEGEFHNVVPLYTHPVKELTDEEIIKVYEDMLGVASAKGSAIDFARAIMKRCGIISGTDK